MSEKEDFKNKLEAEARAANLASKLVESDGFEFLDEYLKKEILLRTNKLIEPTSTREEDLVHKAYIGAYKGVYRAIDIARSKGKKAKSQLENLDEV